MNLLSQKFLSEFSVDLFSIVWMFFFSVVLGFLIAFTYRKTHRGFSYSQSFSISLILMTVITTFIVFVIQDSLARAIGIFGAFSIIRFRTAIKDVRDIAFVFFALAAGLSIGAGFEIYGLFWTILIVALIFLLYKTNFGGLRKLEYVLNFKMEAKEHSPDIFKRVMDQYLKKQNLLNVDAKQRGAVLVFTFNISFKSDDDLNSFVSTMNDLEGVSDVSVVSSKNDLEF